MNLYEKLVEVRKTCKYLKKDNKGHQFQYVSSSQTLGTLRDAMDKFGLILVPNVIGHSVQHGQTAKGGKEVFTELEMEFTWINAEKPDETIKVPFYAQGVDNSEKGVGKALTYGEKYFMLKFFNIATDKDDPDSFQQRAEVGREYNPSGDISKINGCKTLDELQAIWLGLSKEAQHHVSVQHAKNAMKDKIMAANSSGDDPITPEQVKYIQTFYSNSQLSGNRELRLQDLASRAGLQELKSTKDLTKEQASRIIDGMQKG